MLTIIRISDKLTKFISTKKLILILGDLRRGSIVFPFLDLLPTRTYYTNIIVLSCATYPWRNANVTHAFYVKYLDV